MRQIGIRFWLLNKRLFKTYSFLVILCLVPVLVAGVRLGVREDSGIAKILLYLPNPEDELSFQIASGLMEDNGVLYYELCDSEEEARKAVESFQADALWIFPRDMRKTLADAAVSGLRREDGTVAVVQREDDVRMLFTRQILCAQLYPVFSYELYVDFVRNECGLPDVTDEELREAYNSTLVEGSLFRMEYLDGGPVEDSNYLLAPVRGILALWLVLCGFAGAMYYMQDEQRGIFSGLPISRRLSWAFGVQGVLLFDAIVIMLAALKIAGVFTTWSREIPAAVLLGSSVLVFCNLFRLLCRRPERLGSCIPLLLTGMLILCPVFLDIGGLRPIQYLLPPYYYLKSIHTTFYLWGMACYTIVLAFACILLYHWQSRHMRA
ncbi:MAG: ABC transporter permease [Acetatifactor sp.]|nr:ABC transporter permease [Acetatifactor sp.]